jgi:CHAD domain-containing protein
MAYRLKQSEDLGTGVRRIASEQLAKIEASFAVPAKGTNRVETATAVHTTRKSIKKTRALLAMVRPVIGPTAFRAINRQLRDIGRRLSNHRDRDMLATTLSELASHVDAKDKRIVGRTLTAAVVKAATAAAPNTSPNDLARQILADLASVKLAIATLDLDGLSPNDLVVGLGRTYRRGRKMFKSIREISLSGACDPETLHAWRKINQRHWRHLQLIAATSSATSAEQIAAAHQLSRCLGAHNDLAVMLRGADIGSTAIKRNDLAALSLLIERQQADLCDRALELAAGVYRRRASELMSELRDLGVRVQSAAIVPQTVAHSNARTSRRRISSSLKKSKSKSIDQ